MEDAADAATLGSETTQQPASTNTMQQTTVIADPERMTPSTDLSMVKAVPPFNEADTRAILRQVEYYFSDQALRADRHLLGLSGGDGNGPVSINEICSFKRMRGWKPKAAVKQILKQSAVLDIDGKKIKRRFPLTVKLSVEPRIDVERRAMEQTLANNPHLTKNMVKPTGFEDGFTNYPITPEEHAKNLRLYDPEYSLELRIENALAHYCSRRKMHQKTKYVFDLWMNYGGISGGPRPFSSGQKDIDNEDLTKEEVIMLDGYFSVSELVVQEEENWTVDFEGTTLGFLSTEFLSWCDWDMPEQVDNICNVMNNFFSFLLHHNVCPEYAHQLESAKAAVDRAGSELHGLAKADKAARHPHSFNAACTVVCDLSWKSEWIVNSWDDSKRAADEVAELTREDALAVMCTGIAVFSTELGLSTDHTVAKIIGELKGTDLTSETIGLETTELQSATGSQAEVFSSLADTVVPAMGLMRCKRWTRPYEPVYDRPRTSSRLPKTFTFIMSEQALKSCSVGMKLDVQLKMTNSGFYWIDQLYNLNPSYYVWLPNTNLSEIKQRNKDLDEVYDFLEHNPAWNQDDTGLLTYNECNVPAEGESVLT